MNHDIDKLRYMVNLFNNCDESFNQEFSVNDLVKLYDAYEASDCDIPPCLWTERQIQDAFDGFAPQWGEHECDPVYENLKRVA